MSGSRVRMVSRRRISRPYLGVNGGLLSGSPRSVAGSLLPVPLPPGSTGVVSGAVGDGRAVAWDDARARVGAVSAPNGTLVVGPSADSGVPARLVRGLVGAGPFGSVWRVPAGGRAYGDDVNVQGACVVEDARDVLFQHVTGGALAGEARECRFESVYAGGMVGKRNIVLLGVLGVVGCRLACRVAVA